MEILVEEKRGLFKEGCIVAVEDETPQWYARTMSYWRQYVGRYVERLYLTLHPDWHPVKSPYGTYRWDYERRRPRKCLLKW